MNTKYLLLVAVGFCVGCGGQEVKDKKVSVPDDLLMNLKHQFDERMREYGDDKWFEICEIRYSWGYKNELVTVFFRMYDEYYHAKYYVTDNDSIKIQISADYIVAESSKDVIARATHRYAGKRPDTIVAVCYKIQGLRKLHIELLRKYQKR